MTSRSESFEELCRIMHRLRAPGGCPWDREQTHSSLLKYLIEESYEVAEAIEIGMRTRRAGWTGRRKAPGRFGGGSSEKNSIIGSPVFPLKFPSKDRYNKPRKTETPGGISISEVFLAWEGARVRREVHKP